MARHWASGCFSFFVALMALVAQSFGSSELIEGVQSHLNSGQAARAVAAAESRLAAAPDDDQARFALGAIQFLQSVERLSQGLHRYGLRGGGYRADGGLLGLPLLRMPVPPNPNPDELTYEALRDILKTFVDDLAAAEATLSEIKSDQIDLPLNIGLIRLDLNNDGEGSDDESLWLMFRVVAGAVWLDEEAAEQLNVDFDASDVAWLRAYCHLLMAIAEFPLAHDWHEAFEISFPSIFHMPSSPNLRLGEVYEAEPEIAMGLEDRSMIASIADLIAFVHLNHWPVVEPQRMRNVLGHLERMVQLSRENWERILAEPDQGKVEWIPNLTQTGALPRMQVTQRQIDGWTSFLDEFEAILEGKKLIPHWRFDEGINMRRFFLEPSTFDIVLLIQGSAALPYLDEGELTTGDTWFTIMNLFGGDFFRYFIWFN